MKVGDYDLLRQLNCDSVSVTYSARRDGSDDTVELRVLQSDVDPHVLQQNWTRRLQIVALIQHPGIRRILDLSLDHDPAYFVIAADAGRRLEDVIESEGPLAPSDGIPFLADLAGALEVAHRMGVAHGQLTTNRIRVLEDAHSLIDLTEVIPTTDKPLRLTTAMSDDVLDLGRLMEQLVPFQVQADGTIQKTAISVSTELRDLLSQMTSADPEQRPPVSKVAAALRHEAECLFSETVSAPPAMSPADEAPSGTQACPPPQSPPIRTVRIVGVGDRLGRYQLLEELGQGGMGAVFRARDDADGSTVAVKTLHPELAQTPEARRRFQREARLLAEVNTPYVTRLIEFNEDGGVPYLVMEFIEGKTIQHVIDEEQQIDEARATAIMRDVCHAVGEAHRRGIIHRDIKPANILLTTAPQSAAENQKSQTAATSEKQEHVKLTDFGVARTLESTDTTQLTRVASAVGTPTYMPPEQCEDGRTADPRSDVYSAGATLFHMLSGRPPFVGTSFAALSRMHLEEAPPDLRLLNEQLTDSVCTIVDRSLCKRPDDRFSGGTELAEALDHLLHGQVTDASAHPATPDDIRDRVLTFCWAWELKSSPEELWPHVSNTDRFNRAVGLPVVRFTDERDQGGRIRRFGQFSKFGINVRWREHPFEWIEGRRFGVLREYTEGPFRWVSSVVEFHPMPRGTRLSHTLQIQPASTWGRLLAHFEIGFRARREFAKVYRRIDDSLASAATHSSRVAFDAPEQLTRQQWKRLEAGLERLHEAGVAHQVVEQLGDFLAESSPLELARIRPFALADQLQLDREEVLSGCLHAADAGLLVLCWDVLCPVCRIASELTDALHEVRDHAHCPACDLDFEVDLVESVELVFRIHEEIRPVDRQTYCVGGPAHLPHVTAQVRLTPQERLKLSLELSPGTYGIGVTGSTTFEYFNVFSGADTPRLEWRHSQTGSATTQSLAPGHQQLTLINDGANEILVRIERMARREDAVSASQVIALPLFRRLFFDEVLTFEIHCSISDVTIVSIRDWDEERGAAILHQARECGGTVHADGDDAAAVIFHDPVSAVRIAADILRAECMNSNPENRPRLGIHRGPARVSGGDSRLHYTGDALNVATEVSELAPAGTAFATDVVVRERNVVAFAQREQLQFVICDADEEQANRILLHRLEIVGTADADS